MTWNLVEKQKPDNGKIVIARSKRSILWFAHYDEFSNEWVSEETGCITHTPEEWVYAPEEFEEFQLLYSTHYNESNGFLWHVYETSENLLSLKEEMGYLIDNNNREKPLLALEIINLKTQRVVDDWQK